MEDGEVVDPPPGKRYGAAQARRLDGDAWGRFQGFGAGQFPSNGILLAHCARGDLGKGRIVLGGGKILLTLECLLFALDPGHLVQELPGNEHQHDDRRGEPHILLFLGHQASSGFILMRVSGTGS